MADLTLAQATAKGWVIERGPAASSPTGGPVRYVKEFVLSGATITGRTPITMGYHIGTGASADRSIKRVSEYAATQAQALAQVTLWENQMAATGANSKRRGIGFTEKAYKPESGGTLD